MPVSVAVTTVRVSANFNYGWRKVTPKTPHEDNEKFLEVKFCVKGNVAGGINTIRTALRQLKRQQFVDETYIDTRTTLTVYCRPRTRKGQGVSAEKNIREIVLEMTDQLEKLINTFSEQVKND